MAKVVGDGAGGVNKYPPAEFSQKYGRVLAPNGRLSTPEEVFGEAKLFDKEVEEKTKLAFRVTMKKLDKLNTMSEERREELAREKIDQVVECFPNSLPEDLPTILGNTKWGRSGKEVGSWEEWWSMHTKVEAALRGQAKRIAAWWSFTGRPYPGDQEVQASLARLASGVLTHPITIGRMIDTYTPKRKKDKPKSVHLMGTDRPEATMIYAGFFIEILNANPGNPIKLTLVSPDPANQQLSKDCSPKAPMLINPNCKLTAWDGLYHDFWSKFINTKKVERPDVAMGIHPGLHADGVFEFWEPTLDLLLEEAIVTVFTTFSEEEYEASLERLDSMFAKYLYKGRNPLGSLHVKQTPHRPDMMWASNSFLIVFQGRTVDMKTMTLIEEPKVQEIQ